MQSNRVIATISMIVATPCSSATYARSQRAAPFGLAGGIIRGVAHLALQPNELDSVFRSVGAPARREETGQPAFRLCEHEKRIAHRRRDEELVAGDLVLPIPYRRRPRRVGPHVRAALLFRHRHADRRAVLLCDRDVARIVDAAVDLRQPLLREFRLQAQRRRRGEGHGDRAAMSRLDLGLHIEPGRPRDMRALARLAPRRGVQSLSDREPNQLVIGGMKAHEIDAAAVAVVGVELGGMAVGECAELRDNSAAPSLAPNASRSALAQSAPSRATPREARRRRRRDCNR